MYFSKISLNPDSVDIEKLVSQSCTDSYREHQQLWNLFAPDPDAKRDFLFRREQVNGWPVYYLVSRRKPESSQSTWTVEHKEYHPKIYNGQKLVFHLRVNPVITLTNENGKRQRHDVVMNLKKQMNYQHQNKKGRPHEMQLIQQAGIEWLEKRAVMAGFKFNQSAVRIDTYTQHQSFKTKQKKPISYSTLDYEGLLTVMDSEVFTKALFNGIGPAKAFGCGLLLVRRI